PGGHDRVGPRGSADLGLRREHAPLLLSGRDRSGPRPRFAGAPRAGAAARAFRARARPPLYGVHRPAERPERARRRGSAAEHRARLLLGTSPRIALSTNFWTEGRGGSKIESSSSPQGVSH